MQNNNHFWTVNSQSSFDMNCQNNDFPPQNPYQLLSPSSNLLFPFFYSPFSFQNYLPQSTHNFLLPNSYSNLNQVSFQSLPEQGKIKIENNQDCCQPKLCHSPSINKPQRSKDENKKFFENSNSQNNQKTYKKQIEDFKNSKNNNLHKKQNQICDVEPSKTYPNIISNLKTLHSQSSNLPMIKQLTKEIIVQTLSSQQPQLEMLMTLKCEIIKLVNQSNKKPKRPIEEIVDDIIKILSIKLTKFKKTKEQMIKYIFRKIFNVRNKPEQIDQNSWKMAQKIHRKNCISFKSMNMKYVEKQFENPIFIELFSIFLNKFHINFQKENQERIDRLNKIVASAVIYQDLTELKSYKKMPWNKNVVENIQVLFQELKQIKKNAQKTLNVYEMMQEEQKEHPLMPQQNSREKGCFLWREKTN